MFFVVGCTLMYRKALIREGTALAFFVYQVLVIEVAISQIHPLNRS